MDFLKVELGVLSHSMKSRVSWVAQIVKNLPATWETWVQFLGQEDPLEKGLATHSSTLAWRIPRTMEPGGLQSRGSQRVGHDWVSNTTTTTKIECANKEIYTLAGEKLSYWNIKSITSVLLEILWLKYI